MKTWLRLGSILLAMMLVLGLATACGGGEDASDGEKSSSAAESEDAENGEDTGGDEGAGSAAETEVIGMPAEFPADVPVHPGTVTAYEPTEVTESTTVHQLTVESSASYDDVVSWYQTNLPAGWSVGFFEEGDNYSGGREAKVALDGGDYTPASPDGLGGGVLVGIVEGDAAQIVTTVTVME